MNDSCSEDHQGDSTANSDCLELDASYTDLDQYLNDDEIMGPGSDSKKTSCAVDKKGILSIPQFVALSYQN